MTILPINTETFISFQTEKNPTPDDALELVKVIYHTKKNTHLICYELPLEIMREIQTIFNPLIKNSYPLPSNITPYNVGYEYNHLSHKFHLAVGTEEMNLYDCSPFYNHSLFSVNGIQTWFYNIDDKIIMEISPSYEWDTCDPEEGEIVPTFEAFMLLYKPIAIHEISKKTAQNWLQQATDYLAIVEPQFEAWSKQPGEHQQQLYRLKEDA